ncbi:uncharacterized protein BP01DRAFT_370555 [Aspergillus saccharolyticus JOP 1030-1]|uniref:S-adenosyl-L-methionine-dependent methyltransferase n=1 Tax=Aspergillus saccharolyticus JOP 1030-1 TaxID=1450539 RepID=A0A318ZTF3_9EURO|nr:hypothetical protein BP01DRAFT_370555 [Aspergillus saccharolyticus JOP 1030-1]PYH49944.1 hypothetical protein BP01DRAFT_370555 [Aspergillus saccharolyticus JOP 1030-1]
MVCSPPIHEVYAAVDLLQRVGPLPFAVPHAMVQTAFPGESHHDVTCDSSGAYWAPNDDKQNTQLDIAHHIDFADEHPYAEVIGTDLSLIQPSFVPPNLQFVIDDACEYWIYPKSHSDYIHTRTLYGAIADWSQFYRKALKHLRPGGFFEQLEMSIQFRLDDGTLPDDHVLKIWSKTMIEASEKLGKTFRIAEFAAGYMRNASFHNVVERRFKLPVGLWSIDKKLKSLGTWNQVHCEHGIEGWAMALLTRVMKVSVIDSHYMLVPNAQGLRDPDVHAYFEVVAVYGQKPMHAI